MFLASPTFTLHMIVHVDPWLCPPAVVVVFAATFAISLNTSCINSPVTAEHLHNGHIASPVQFYTLLVAISSLPPPSSSLSSIRATLPAYGSLLECSVCKRPSAT